jgi:hypothetical protein
MSLPLIDPPMMFAWSPLGGLWPETVPVRSGYWEETTKVVARAVPPRATNRAEQATIMAGLGRVLRKRRTGSPRSNAG